MVTFFSAVVNNVDEVHIRLDKMTNMTSNCKIGNAIELRPYL